MPALPVASGLREATGWDAKDGLAARCVILNAEKT
jgi:hypothetical protein